MATRKQRLGAALEGFTQTFWPAYLNLQETQRRKLSDRQRNIRSIGEQIGKRWLTEEQIEPHIQSVMQDEKITREEAISKLSPFVRTREERVGQAFEGVDLTRATPQQMSRRAQQYGLPYGVEERRALPSTPVLGGGQMDMTGKLMAPLSQPPTERPFIAGATGGTPLELTPFGETFTDERMAALVAEEEQEARKLGYATTRQREEAATALSIAQEQLESQIDITRRMTEAEKRLETDLFIEQSSDPAYQQALLAIELKLRTNQELNDAELAKYEAKQETDFKWTARTLAMTQEPVINSYIDPRTREKLVTVSWWNPETRRSELTSLNDYPYLSDGMKMALQDKVDYSPYLSQPDTLTDYIISMFAPNLVGEDGSIDQGQFTQAVQALVKDTGMSESEARQQVFQSTQPTSAQPGPNIPSSVQKDVLNLIPTPEIVEKVYGTDSYEPDGDPILDDPSGTIKWRVQEGRHFHEISNDDMIKREIRITTGLIKEGQSELSDITRQIDGLGDTYPERQRKMELGLEQKSKQESLEALKNRLKAIPSYFGTDQNQQNPISPGGFSPIGSIGLFPK
jgi:hypothetical protein